MSEELPFDAEAIAGTLAHIAAGQGDAASVAALAVSVPQLKDGTGHDSWDGGRAPLRLYLQVPAQAFAQLFRLREDIQKRSFSYSPANHRILPNLLGICSLHRTGRKTTIQLARRCDGMATW